MKVCIQHVRIHKLLLLVHYIMLIRHSLGGKVRATAAG
jgi:hypothetical protein